jgi:rhamnose utilization protein RhaD (predicted bifunctional aldolase and dehydrogenase)
MSVLNGLETLRSASARLGADVRRTQGAGGNTSLKADGVLYIKASGTWLAHALEKGIFVPVAMEPLLHAFEHDPEAAEKPAGFVVAGQSPLGLRPSIETTVHAVIPHRVVLHIHCVDTLALAIRADAAALIAARLAGVAGVSAAFVPYCRPGLPLARAIVAARAPETNVLVLGNHGLVVSGQTVDEAMDRLEAVCGALATTPRPAAAGDLASLTAMAEGTDYRLPSDADAHAVATDPVRLALAAKGSFYPDHVIFLGRGVTVLDAGGAIGSLTANAQSLMIAVPGVGVLLHKGVLGGADLMARCLAEVLGRVPEGAALKILTTAEEDQLTNWDAEKYRQAQARAS